MHRLIQILLLSFSLIAAAEAQAQVPDHSLLTRILSHSVTAEGLVDYEAIKHNRHHLDTYLKSLQAVALADLGSKADQLAYLINLYNALVLQSVIDHWPLKSVLNDFPGNAFFEKWKHATSLGELTLNQLENEVIRKKFEEPRVHFALNCASMGCPVIQSEAFTGAQLAEQLDRATIQFVNDPDRNRIDIKKKAVQVSSIFDWYGDDFKQSGGVLAFFAKYSKSPERAQIPNLKIEFLPYDWNVNAGKRR